MASSPCPGSAGFPLKGYLCVTYKCTTDYATTWNSLILLKPTRGFEPHCLTCNNWIIKEVHLFPSALVTVW